MTSFTSFFCRVLTFSALVITLTTANVIAQDFSEDEVNPVDATVFGPEGENDDPNEPKRLGMVKPGGTYRSDSLGGEFVAEWMRITIGSNQNGQSFLFWGARAVALDKDSPLRDLRMRMNNGRFEQFQVGDVVTRMDDIKIEDGMFKNRKGVWQIPELDEHFGPTTFRWIKSGHAHVNVSQITLDNDAVRGTGGSTLQPVAP